MIEEGVGGGPLGLPATLPPNGQDICATFLDLLPIDGVSVTAVGSSDRQSTICASDPVAARLEELQFELGEGPHWKALRTGLPVLVPDVREEDRAEWPVFASAALQTGVRALFSFPLFMGAVTVGVVDLYRSRPGALDDTATASALSLAGIAAGPVVRRAVQDANDETLPVVELTAEMRREVHQATGMVLVQLGVSATEAFFRMKGHAYSNGKTLQYVAELVVARRLDFSQLAE